MDYQDYYAFTTQRVCQFTTETDKGTTEFVQLLLPTTNHREFLNELKVFHKYYPMFWSPYMCIVARHSETPAVKYALDEMFGGYAMIDKINNNPKTLRIEFLEYWEDSIEKSYKGAA